MTTARGSLAMERAELEAAEATPEALAAGKEILETVMGHLGFEGVTVEIREGETSRLNVVGDGPDREALGSLIGRKGERLSALQHLVNLMLSRRTGQWTRVLVDVEDYRGRRERQLEDLAARAAERVARPARCSSSSRCRPSSGAGSTWPCATTPMSRRSRSARSRTAASSSSRETSRGEPRAREPSRPSRYPHPRPDPRPHHDAVRQAWWDCGVEPPPGAGSRHRQQTPGAASREVSGSMNAAPGGSLVELRTDEALVLRTGTSR